MAIRETERKISAEYGNGIARVEFKTVGFEPDVLRGLARMLIINSLDVTNLLFSYKDGTTRNMDRDDLREANRLEGESLEGFLDGIVTQMERAGTVTVWKTLEPQEHYTSVTGTEIYRFIESLDTIDEVKPI